MIPRQEDGHRVGEVARDPSPTPLKVGDDASRIYGQSLGAGLIAIAVVPGSQV